MMANEKIERFLEIERRGILDKLPTEKRERWEEYKRRHPEIIQNKAEASNIYDKALAGAKYVANHANPISAIISDVSNANIEDNLGRIGTFSNNATFGMGNKVGAAINAIGAAPIDALLTDKDFGQAIKDRYNEIAENAAKTERNYQKNNPKEALAISLAGSVANPLNIKGANYVNSATKFLPKVARAAGVGGATAAADTIGNAENFENIRNNITENIETGAIVNSAFPILGQAMRGAQGAISKILGTTSGAGSEAVSTAYQAGKRGSQTFKNNLRNNSEMQDIVDKSRAALDELKILKNEQYANNIAAVNADKSTLDLKPIINRFSALKKEYQVGKFSKAGKNTQKAIKEIESILEDFSSQPEIHNAEGFDALKRRLQDIDFPYEAREANAIVKKVATSVKNSISNQAPVYSRIMKDYSEASDIIQELEKTLSLGKNKSYDTALRKLQSVFRNNVSSNYGNRSSLLKQLEQGGDEISDALAGQALNSWSPRGILGGSLGGAAGAASVYTNPWSLASFPAFSPRTVGEAAYASGRAANAVLPLAEAFKENINPSALYFALKRKE